MIRRRPSLLLVAVASSLVLATPFAARATSMTDFGRCLARSGAVFYGASWCPHCRAQRVTLGDAMANVRYVECSVAGQRAATPACKAAGVTGYPTWIFGDGSRAEGEQALERLAAKTGCTLPASRERNDAPLTRSGDHAPSRAKVIEVPN